MTRLNKEDWEALRESAEQNLKKLEISTIEFTSLLELTEKKIAEFPDEVKEVEEEIEKLDETRASG